MASNESVINNGENDWRRGGERKMAKIMAAAKAKISGENNGAWRESWLCSQRVSCISHGYRVNNAAWRGARKHRAHQTWRSVRRMAPAPRQAATALAARREGKSSAAKWKAAKMAKHQ
jgi:hypothetical protein